MSGTLPSGYTGGVKDPKLLQRYYGGSLPACKDPAYTNPSTDPNLKPGMCGWSSGISYYGDDQNTKFDALQVTMAQNMKNGLSVNANYQWASAFADQNNFWTWSHVVTHIRDSNVRRQQATLYGSYDLPFGKGKQLLKDANRVTDLIVGGYQIAGTFTLAGGLPWSPGFGEFNPAGPDLQNCNEATGSSSAPCRPNAHGHMKTSLTSFDPATHSRSFFKAQPRTGGIFSFPGLDKIGNAGANTYTGPSFWTSDMNLSKSFSIWESVAIKFRMDAFNAFNHITAGNPSNDVLGGNTATAGDKAGSITGQGQGCDQPGASCGPRQLEFSLRVQF